MKNANTGAEVAIFTKAFPSQGTRGNGNDEDEA
jgi:hypothetical protein